MKRKSVLLEPSKQPEHQLRTPLMASAATGDLVILGEWRLFWRVYFASFCTRQWRDDEMVVKRPAVYSVSGLTSTLLDGIKVYANNDLLSFPLFGWKWLQHTPLERLLCQGLVVGLRVNVVHTERGMMSYKLMLSSPITSKLERTSLHSFITFSRKGPKILAWPINPSRSIAYPACLN